MPEPISVDKLAAIFISICALGVSLTACVTSIRSLRNSYRPLLRPVPQFINNALQQNVVMVKNIGNGPAVSVVLYRDQKPPIILTKFHAVEKLGASLASSDKHARIGRDKLLLKDGKRIELGVEYRLAYQDIAGAWHISGFAVQPNGFIPRLFGRESEWWEWPVRWIRVPPQVEAEGQIIQGEDM